MVGSDRASAAGQIAKAPEVTLVDVLNAIGGANKDLDDVASIVEQIAQRVAGPFADEKAGTNASRETGGPVGMVDALHDAARLLHEPTSRIRRALNVIDRRISA